MAPNQINIHIKKQAWLASSTYQLILNNINIAQERVDKMKEHVSRLSKPKAIEPDNFKLEMVTLAVDIGQTKAHLKYYKAELATWICFANYDKTGVESWLEKVKERGLNIMKFYEELGHKVFREKCNEDGTVSEIGTENEYRVFCEKLQGFVNNINENLSLLS